MDDRKETTKNKNRFNGRLKIGLLAFFIVCQVRFLVLLVKINMQPCATHR